MTRKSAYSYSTFHIWPPSTDKVRGEAVHESQMSQSRQQPLEVTNGTMTPILMTNF